MSNSVHIRGKGDEVDIYMGRGIEKLSLLVIEIRWLDGGGGAFLNEGSVDEVNVFFSVCGCVCGYQTNLSHMHWALD